jgi:nitroreductase/dihydropteridine reductase
MSFLQKMQQRYTTKKYDANKKIDTAKLEALKEILQLSPSSINSQPWKFTFVSDTKTKAELAKASLFNEKKILDCHTLVVFSSISNLSLFEQQIKEELPEGAVGYYNQFIKPLPETTIKLWLEKQVYLALGVFLGACAEMEIDATPMEGIEPDKYNAILSSQNYHALVAVAIGYRDVEDANQPSIKPKSRRKIQQVIEVI